MDISVYLSQAARGSCVGASCEPPQSELQSNMFSLDF